MGEIEKKGFLIFLINVKPSRIEVYIVREICQVIKLSETDTAKLNRHDQYFGFSTCGIVEWSNVF